MCCRDTAATCYDIDGHRAICLDKKCEDYTAAHPKNFNASAVCTPIGRVMAPAELGTTLERVEASITSAKSNIENLITQNIVAWAMVGVIIVLLMALSLILRKNAILLKRAKALAPKIQTEEAAGKKAVKASESDGVSLMETAAN